MLFSDFRFFLKKKNLPDETPLSLEKEIHRQINLHLENVYLQEMRDIYDHVYKSPYFHFIVIHGYKYLYVNVDFISPTYLRNIHPSVEILSTSQSFHRSFVRWYCNMYFDKNEIPPVFGRHLKTYTQMEFEKYISRHFPMQKF